MTALWTVIETNADFGAHDATPFAKLYQSKEAAMAAIHGQLLQVAKDDWDGLCLAEHFADVQEASGAVEAVDHGDRVFATCEWYDAQAQWLIAELEVAG